MMQIFLPSRTNHVMIKLQTLNTFSKDAVFAYLGYTCLYETVDNDCDHIDIEKYNVLYVLDTFTLNSHNN